MELQVATIFFVVYYYRLLQLFLEYSLLLFFLCFHQNHKNLQPFVLHNRSMHKHLDIPDPKVEVPAMLIMGEEDYVFKFPGIEDYIRSGEVMTYVPNLETIYVPEGTHFVQEQFPDQVNQLLLTFLSSHN